MTVMNRLSGYRKALTVAIQNGFAKRPVTMNVFVYGTLYIGAEFTQQIVYKKLFPEHKEPLDFKSLARYAFLGTVIYPPFYFYWYRWLDRRYVGTSVAVVMKKLGWDQFILAPLNIMFFYTIMSAMEFKEDILAEAKQKLVPTFKTSCYFWIPAQILNFAVIPPPARVAYVGTCMFIWVNILCYYKRQHVKDE